MITRTLKHYYYYQRLYLKYVFIMYSFLFIQWFASQALSFVVS